MFFRIINSNIDIDLETFILSENCHKLEEEQVGAKTVKGFISAILQWTNTDADTGKYMVDQIHCK